MAKARALDRRRGAVRNIRKITRTMELIASARFRKAMDRATAAAAYTRRMSRMVSDLARADLEIHHPLLEDRSAVRRVVLLILTANRGMCGGYNAAVMRLALEHRAHLMREFPHTLVEVSGRRGAAALLYRQIIPDQAYTHFDDRPTYGDVEVLANRYLEDFLTHRTDRLDVVFTKFFSASRQEPTVETLLPLSSLDTEPREEEEDTEEGEGRKVELQYEMLPSAASILDEMVPTSFRVKLFKCFLDAAVCEQIARMVAMKAATENADELIRQLSMAYNRARQAQITGEIMEILGGVEALQS
jgi:F-type H+-transporting ATPase subunit gamma